MVVDIPGYVESESEQIDPETIALKDKIFKAIVVVTALVCCIMVIFILAKTSQYFSYLFSLTT